MVILGLVDCMLKGGKPFDVKLTMLDDGKSLLVKSTGYPVVWVWSVAALLLYHCMTIPWYCLLELPSLLEMVQSEYKECIVSELSTFKSI